MPKDIWVRRGGPAELKTYQFTVAIEPDEEAFHAFVPGLPGCHTSGMTVEEVRANIAEAMGPHIESMQADGEPIPVERQWLFITRLSVPMIA